MGGMKNFLKQHNPGVSKACQLNLKKKNKADPHPPSQPGLLSFFTKQPKGLIPPTIPTPAPVIAYAMESSSQLSGTHVTGVAPITASPAPCLHAVNILTTLERVIEDLPVLPDASESDEIAMFSGNVPADLAKDDAWEYLDPMLNRFLGFNRSAESIYNELRGGERGLSAMVRYLKDFVNQYQIDGALLEGKIKRLVNAIQTQYVALTSSNCTHFLLMLDLHRTSPNHSDVIMVSDDDDVPSQMQEIVISIKKNMQVSNAPAKPCSGYRLLFPPGQQAHTSYPFALHTLLPLTWDYSGGTDGFFLISHFCTGIARRNGPCKRCDDLVNNEYLQKIIARFTNGIHENAALVYHGVGGLIDIVRRKTKAIDLFRLHRLNDSKRLIGKEGTIDIHKQMLLAISSQRIPRVDRVLRVGFRTGAGIQSMLELVKKAAEGTYHPKGSEEEEDLQALLFLRLGGARVADIAHRIFGTPGVSTIRKRTIIPPIIASPSFPTSHEIEGNIAASFKAISDLLGASTQKMLHAVIMFDEISVEARPRWDDKTNNILGVCHEHGCRTSLEFTSEEDLHTLWEEFQCGKIHLACEVRVDVCDGGVLNDNNLMSRSFDRQQSVQ